MTPNASPVLLRITLTYEELSLVLKLMNADLLPGLRSPQPAAETPEAQVQGLLCAERSLRARELARLTPDNHLVVHAALLSAVGTCAFADQVVVLQHVAANGNVVELYGSVKEEVAVAHTRPEPGLHQLAVLQDIAALAQQALAVGDCQELQPVRGSVLAVTDAALRQAQELAKRGQLGEAAAQLADGADAPSAAALVEALSVPHAVSIFLCLQRQADDTILRRELTVLHTTEAAWLVTPLPGQAAMCRVAPVTSMELLDALVAELSPAPRVAISA